ncbi:MAG: GNAT family N-acetyltransferase [Candidatus Eisenbacteria bacterium]|nr:GNAT family N-acetyltransferase [Candidatus Eisenbacteria bacterium]
MEASVAPTPDLLAPWREKYPEKFASTEEIFRHVHRGDRIFIGTGCGEPQYLVNELIRYVDQHPLALFDTEVLQVWSLGVAPYADVRFKRNFRHNSFFIGSSTRQSVNEGHADYTPIALSQVVNLILQGSVPIDVALIQVSPPDPHGYVSLGISVDIVKAAAEKADLVIAQINHEMPRVLGDTFLPIEVLDFIVPHDEPLLEYGGAVSDEIAERIGRHAARIVRDGDTIQVGYGNIPNAILANLREKKSLGVHTELLSDGLVDLIRRGVIDNSRKSIDRGKSVATFCMGSHETYRYLHDNPSFMFRTTSYTNDPLLIASQENMVAINTALAIDLTGQATAESISTDFYSGVGGQGDFMRGAAIAPGGRTILAMQATAANETVSRIVPVIAGGAGVTLTRTDVRYVVTEYGIAYVHGKNIRTRAMDLIAIAHPKFRPWLIEEARRLKLIYADQGFVPGAAGEYPEHLEIRRTTKGGAEILLRPVKISDEPLLADFFRKVSDETLRRRFMSIRTEMPHERLQELTIVDYTEHMVILAVLEREGQEEAVGIGQYRISEESNVAEVGLVVRDDYQNRGIGRELIKRLTQLARQRGLYAFTAQVLIENRQMLHLFENSGFEIRRHVAAGTVHLQMSFGAGK